MKVGAQINKDKNQFAGQQQAEGVRMGVDIAKSKEQMALERMKLHHAATQKQEKKPK